MQRSNKSSKEKIYRNNGNAPVLQQVKGENLRILDVGCGAGDNAKVLRSMGHSVDGITLSVEESILCKEIMDNVYIHNLEEGLPEDVTAEYDIVICSHVLEHIAYPDSLLKDIAQRLKKDGKLIVALPNLMHYKSRIQLMAGNFHYLDSGIWDNTHLRWYTYRSGSELLSKHGFKVVFEDVDGEIPFLTVTKVLPLKLRKSAFNFLKLISPGLFGGQLIYVAQMR